MQMQNFVLEEKLCLKQYDLFYYDQRVIQCLKSIFLKWRFSSFLRYGWIQFHEILNECINVANSQKDRLLCLASVL